MKKAWMPVVLCCAVGCSVDRHVRISVEGLATPALVVRKIDIEYGATPQRRVGAESKTEAGGEARPAYLKAPKAARVGL